MSFSGPDMPKDSTQQDLIIDIFNEHFYGAEKCNLHRRNDCIFSEPGVNNLRHHKVGECYQESSCSHRSF